MKNMKQLERPDQSYQESMEIGISSEPGKPDFDPHFQIYV